MKARNFLTVLLIFCASCAFADISPDKIKSNEYLSSLIERTKLEGVKSLPGRYVLIAEVKAKPSGQDLFAPTYAIMNIEPLSYSQDNLPSYITTVDLYENGGVSAFITTLDVTGDAPVLRMFNVLEDGLKKIEENYAFIRDYTDGSLTWFEISASTGKQSLLVPLNENFFPKDWYIGSWIEQDASVKEPHKFTFNDDRKFYINDEYLGIYSVIDNRIFLNGLNDKRSTIFALYGKSADIMIMRFQGITRELDETVRLFKHVK